MAVNIIGIADRLFLSQFRTCVLPFAEWTHQNHVRLAYLSAWEQQLDMPAVMASVRTDIQRFNSLHADKLTVGYHETMTRFWTHVICARAAPHGPVAFSRFWACEANELQSRAWERFYSRGVMFSNEAKMAYVMPDLCGLPELPAAVRRAG